MYGFFTSNAPLGKCIPYVIKIFFSLALIFSKTKNITNITYNPHKHWVLMFENFLKHRTLPFFSNNSKTTMPKTPNVLQNQKQRTLQRKQRTIAKQQERQSTKTAGGSCGSHKPISVQSYQNPHKARKTYKTGKAGQGAKATDRRVKSRTLTEQSCLAAEKPRH